MERFVAFSLNYYVKMIKMSLWRMFCDIIKIGLCISLKELLEDGN